MTCPPSQNGVVSCSLRLKDSPRFSTGHRRVWLMILSSVSSKGKQRMIHRSGSLIQWDQWEGRISEAHHHCLCSSKSSNSPGSGQRDNPWLSFTGFSAWRYQSLLPLEMVLELSWSNLWFSFFRMVQNLYIQQTLYFKFEMLTFP